MGIDRPGCDAETVSLKTPLEPLTPSPTTGMIEGFAAAIAWSIVCLRGALPLPTLALKAPRAPKAAPWLGCALTQEIPFGRSVSRSLRGARGAMASGSSRSFSERLKPVPALSSTFPFGCR